MFVKYAEAFLIFPGGFGTLDELFEALVLIQTHKLQNFPVVLFGTSYWRGMMDWIQHTLMEEHMISPDDLGLLSLTDDPTEMCRIVVDSFRSSAGNGAVATHDGSIRA